MITDIKVCEEIGDLTCANCVYSDEGSDEDFRSCCLDQTTLLSQTEVQSDSFCGQGEWLVESSNEGNETFFAAYTRPECMMVIENQGRA